MKETRSMTSSDTSWREVTSVHIQFSEGNGRCQGTRSSVQQGDTLSSVADRFNRTASWLHLTNSLFTEAIFPGDELQIVSLPAESARQIDCHLYFTDKRLPDIPGHLLISGDELRFESSRPQIVIPLTNHAHHKLMPHPRLQLASGSICHADRLRQEDHSSRQRANNLLLGASRAPFGFNWALDAFAAELKRRRRVTEVTLDDIPGPVVKPPLRDI
jgi:hypothetical protein